MKNFLLFMLFFLQSCTSLLSNETSSLKERSSTPRFESEACFSPDEPCSEKLIKFIESAKESIDIAIFAITLQSVADAIIKQQKNLPSTTRPSVRVITDSTHSRKSESLVNTLREANIPIRIGQKVKFMHSKFIIIDSKFVETGSFNFTDSAAEKNEENQVYLSDPKLVKRFVDRFEKIWAKAKEL